MLDLMCIFTHYYHLYLHPDCTNSDLCCVCSDVQKYGEFLLKGNAKNVEPLYLEGPPDGETVDMNSSTCVCVYGFRKKLIFSHIGL